MAKKPKRTTLTKIGVRAIPSDAAGGENPRPRYYASCPCVACQAPLIWALDDRHTAKEEIGSLFDCNPDPQGFAVLWYAVDRHGIPLDDKQWFRVPDASAGYTGPLWSRHVCSGVKP